LASSPFFALIDLALASQNFAIRKHYEAHHGDEQAHLDQASLYLRYRGFLVLDQDAIPEQGQSQDFSSVESRAQ